MVALPNSVPMPLRTDAYGVIRVGGTRVTLQSVIYEYQRGSGPKEIAEAYSVLAEADIYYVIGYYLAHRAEVDAYMAREEEAAAALRQAWEAEHPPVTRAELLARLDRKRRNSEG